MSALSALLSELTSIKRKAAGSYCDAVLGHLNGATIDTSAFASLFTSHRLADKFNTEVMGNQTTVATEAEKLMNAVRELIIGDSGLAEAGG